MVNDDKIYTDQIKQGSPCLGICSVTFDDVCKGCLRTVDEVANWSVMTEKQRIIIWDRILSDGYKKP